MLAPELGDILNVDQVRLNADNVTMSLHSAGNHGTNVQVAPDLARINVLALITRHNTARDHAQLRDFRETVYQAFSNLVVEVFGICIRRVVDEW